MADIVLEHRHSRGMHPRKWPELRNISEDLAATEVLEIGDDSDKEEDTSLDPDYNDKAERASSKKSERGSSRKELSYNPASSSDSEEEDIVQPKRLSETMRVISSSDSSSDNDDKPTSRVLMLNLLGNVLAYRVQRPSQSRKLGVLVLGRLVLVRPVIETSNHSLARSTKI